MKQVWIIAFVVSIAGCTGTSPVKDYPVQSPAEYDKVKREICENTQCQRNVRVRLRKKDGSTYDQTFDFFPGTVQEIGITVIAGQALNIEAEVREGKPTTFRAVDVVTNPERTIVAKFTQMENGGMMLSLHNPFERALKFNMAMMPLDKEDFFKTSSCPVIPKGASYEIWPEPLFQLLLTNAQFMDITTSMSCEY